MLRPLLAALQVIIGPNLALVVLTVQAASANIRVFSGGAPKNALGDLVPDFEHATGHRVAFTFRIVSEIQQSLEAGEKADLILLPVP